MIAIVLLGLSFGAPLVVVTRGLANLDHARRFAVLARLRQEVTFAEARNQDLQTRCKRLERSTRKARLAKLARDQYVLRFPDVGRVA